MSEMDVAKLMFGWANEPQSLLSAAYSTSSTNVRYGTVVAENEDGTYQVELDTGEVITMESQTPLSVGDRVQIVNQGGSWVLYAMDTFVAQTRNAQVELAEAIKAKGEEISQEVLDALAAFEESHGLEDMDVSTVLTELEGSITRTFVGEIDEEGVEYKTLSELTQSVYGLEASAEKYYTNDEVGWAALKSTIEQNPDIISSVVESEVTNVAGDTYATKTELSQTSSSLTAKISGAVSTAEAAQETADDNADFIETHFTADTSGLTIESSASSYKTRVTSSSFDILNASDTMLLTMGVLSTGYPALSAGSAFGSFALQGATSYGWLKIGSTIDVGGAKSDFGLRRTGWGDDEGYYYAGFTLYHDSSGTSGTVTLSPYSASSFRFLEIQYTDGTRYMTKRVYDPNGKSVVLDRIVSDGSDSYLMSSVATISGRSITRSMQYQTQYLDGAWGVHDYYVKILAVIGWGW